jgi:polyisoprenoid-binding protein YceI
MTHATDHRAANTTSPALPDGVWSVDPQRGEIGFAVKAMWGLQTVRGVFGAYDGSLQVRSGAVAGMLTIRAASLDTGHRRRDRHLRSPDFFDVERHPRIVFTPTALASREGGLTVAGELAIGSVRARLEVPMDVAQTADGGLRLEGHTTVSRQDVGLTWNMLGTIGGVAELYARLTLEPDAG